MAKYDNQKIYAELGKLTTDQQYEELQNIISFVYENLEAEKDELEKKQNEIQQKLQTINSK